MSFLSFPSFLWSTSFLFVFSLLFLSSLSFFPVFPIFPLFASSSFSPAFLSWLVLAFQFFLFGNLKAGNRNRERTQVLILTRWLHRGRENGGCDFWVSKHINNRLTARDTTGDSDCSFHNVTQSVFDLRLFIAVGQAFNTALTSTKKTTGAPFHVISNLKSKPHQPNHYEGACTDAMRFVICDGSLFGGGERERHRFHDSRPPWCCPMMALFSTQGSWVVKFFLHCRTSHLWNERSLSFFGHNVSSSFVFQWFLRFVVVVKLSSILHASILSLVLS